MAANETPDRGALHAFGLCLRLDTPPPGAWRARPGSEPDLQLQIVAPREIGEHWSGREQLGWQARIDGVPLTVERGRAGDHRFVHGERAVHHLSADAAILRCAPRDPERLSWWRVVLDSVLFSAALLSGYEALHAGAVATPAGAVAILAGAGGGKSTLLVELLGLGLPLLTDDVVVLQEQAGAAPLAHPGPPLMTVPAVLEHSFRGPNTNGGAPFDQLGSVIAAVGDERWAAVVAHPDPIPLAALVLLDRRPELASALERVRDPLAPLIGSLLGFPQYAERERARFELAGAIAEHVPIWRLSADPGVGARELGERLLAGLPELHGTPT
jgi:hypothetical protein